MKRHKRLMTRVLSAVMTKANDHRTKRNTTSGCRARRWPGRIPSMCWDTGVDEIVS